MSVPRFLPREEYLGKVGGVQQQAGAAAALGRMWLVISLSVLPGSEQEH